MTYWISIAFVIAVVTLGALASLTSASSKGSRTLDGRTSSITRIDGAAAGDRAGAAIASAGDVNGDGRADIIVGAPLADPNARIDAGAAYVVFGPLKEPRLQLAALGERGFRIDGAAPDDHAGLVVDGAGDVNADGLGDLVVAGPNAGRGSDGTGRGWATFVVFGKRAAANVDLAALGESGYKIDGAGDADTDNRIAAGAGDVNRDGRADTIVGSPSSKGSARRHAGGAYVVFGSPSPGTVDLRSLGRRGFHIIGSPRTGLVVDGVGDVNGDRRSDVVVGGAAGTAYVAFGKATNDAVVLARLAGKGFGIADDNFGTASSSVAGAGDVNGDGRADLIVSNAEPDVGFNTYVVFGKRSRGLIRLRSLRRARRGFTIVARNTDTGTDHEVASAGDVNGDGRADVIVSAVLAGSRAKTRSLASYVVFGRRSARPVRLGRLGRAGVALTGLRVPLDHQVPTPRVAGLGDVAGSRRDDVAVTDYLGDGSGRPDAGVTYVVSGSRLGSVRPSP